MSGERKEASKRPKPRRVSSWKYSSLLVVARKMGRDKTYKLRQCLRKDPRKSDLMDESSELGRLAFRLLER